MTDNTVTMGLASYNSIKAENTRFQMFISRLFEDAELRGDYSGIEFDIRCKDCKHLGIKDFAYGYCTKKMSGIVEPDDFCSYGERRDGKDDKPGF